MKYIKLIKVQICLIFFLPDGACHLQPSEPSLCSSSLQSAHTSAYFPAMSLWTAPTEDKKRWEV